MKIIATDIPEVLIVEPQVFGDDRGFFFESFNRKCWQEQMGMDISFVQLNHSCSEQNVLRGLHYQIEQTQGKLVRVISGEVFDVAVDIRRSSPTFGKWVGVYLSAANRKQFWVPEGFAHGFYVLSESAEFIYLTTDFYAPEHERAIIWNDPELNVSWPLLEQEPVLSEKDQIAVRFRDAQLFA